jgi:hypothetical protein
MHLDCWLYQMISFDVRMRSIFFLAASWIGASGLLALSNYFIYAHAQHIPIGFAHAQ